MNLCERIKSGECPFGMLKEGQTMAECPSGFPGCGCMDELMLDPDFIYNTMAYEAKCMAEALPCDHGEEEE